MVCILQYGQFVDYFRLTANRRTEMEEIVYLYTHTYMKYNIV